MLVCENVVNFAADGKCNFDCLSFAADVECSLHCVSFSADILQQFRMMAAQLTFLCGLKGGRVLLMSPPPLSEFSGLSFDSTFLSAPLLFCLVLLLILCSPSFCFWPGLLPILSFKLLSRDRLFGSRREAGGFF